MKILLIIACIGHIICGITDCMLAYMKNGKFEFSDVKDNEKMKRVFDGASLRQIELAMLIGVFAIFLASLGYISVSKMIMENSPAAIEYVGLLVFDVLLFIMVITGKTNLPRWACVFNTLPAFLIMTPTKVPAKGNIANAFMFLGLTIASW